MVMEFLDGETLAARIERHGRLTPLQIAPIARQILTALVSAHAAGIIHRDLKPDNIFILRSKAGRADFVKLIDFGISKFSRPFFEGEQRMTRADAVIGTPCYMSPEQARGARETDVRSDIYSCGVILYESVTGRLPFEGDSFNDLMFKIALSDAPSPLTFVPSLDPDFAALISRAIARDPDARFATAQAFAEALDEWMRKNSLTETLALPRPSDAFPSRIDLMQTSPTLSPTVAIESPASLERVSPEESWARTSNARARRGPRIAAASAVGLIAAGVAIALMVRPDPAPSTLHAGPDPIASAATALTATRPTAVAAGLLGAASAQAPDTVTPAEPSASAASPRRDPVGKPAPSAHSPALPKTKPADIRQGLRPWLLRMHAGKTLS